jgi:yapsin 1
MYWRTLGLVPAAILWVCVQGSFADIPEGVVALEMNRTSHPLLHQRKVGDLGNPIWNRAAQDMVDNLDNKKYFYSLTANIGTPPQPVDLLIDTGSSDTWVFTPSTKYARSKKPTSFFNPAQSQSFAENNTNFNIAYGIGNVQGIWATDTMAVAGAAVSHLPIGIATQADVAQGIVGIGRKEAECTVKSNGYTYDNLPWLLRDQGMIKAAAYSMFLGDYNSPTGTLLLGGVDKSKVAGGKLGKCPISHPKHLAINLQGMEGDGRDPGQLLTYARPAVLDSGTTMSYFSGDVIGRIHMAFNANPSFTIGQKYYCDCNTTNVLWLNFGCAQVAVPNYYFLWPIETVVNKLVAYFSFPDNSCYISLEQGSSDMDYYLLGDNILRAIYAVYDLENGQIAVGQANPNGGPPDLEAITPSYIPLT